jgi:density-regulated protein DRP1
LKKAAKQFASKFACGSSVTKSAEGTDEIVVQGDVQDELEDYILQNYPQIPGDLIDLISK